MDKTVKYRWVLKQYQPDERGKQVLTMAKTRSGYVLINKDRSPTDSIIVAFKLPDFKGLGEGMVEASPAQSLKLEKYK